MDADQQEAVFNQYMNMIEPLAQVIIEDARDYMQYVEEAGYTACRVIDNKKGYIITIKQIEHDEGV